MRKYILIVGLVSLLTLILQAEGVARLNLLFNPELENSGSEAAPPSHVIDVTVTAYSPSEEECDSDPYVTAFQKPVKEGTIAISRDLENELGWRVGDRIHLGDLGIFEVNDRMHYRWKKRVDIFFHDQEKAVSFGIKQAKVLKVEKRENKGA